MAGWTSRQDPKSALILVRKPESGVGRPEQRDGRALHGDRRMHDPTIDTHHPPGGANHRQGALERLRVQETAAPLRYLVSKRLVAPRRRRWPQDDDTFIAGDQVAN